MAHPLGNRVVLGYAKKSLTQEWRLTDMWQWYTPDTSCWKKYLFKRRIEKVGQHSLVRNGNGN